MRHLLPDLARVLAPVGAEGLRGDEGGGARRVGEVRVLPVELVADSEVGDLHVPVVPQQEVGGLQVPVDDALVVNWGGGGEFL